MSRGNIFRERWFLFSSFFLAIRARGAAAARGAQPSGSTRHGGGVWPWRRQPRPGPAHARAGYARLRGRCRRAVLALLPRVRAASVTPVRTECVERVATRVVAS